MSEILISGYYGFKNSGDDALLQSIINDLREHNPHTEIVVLSKNPEETKKTYNVNAINRTNPLAVLYHMLRARLLISGGGTLIQDATSTKSLIYYLSVIRIARMLGVKVIMYANGIGPVNQDNNKKRTKSVLNGVDCITLRDEKSFEVLKELGITKPEIKITADPAFLLNASDKSRGYDILKKAGAPENKKCIGIGIRTWKNADADFEEKLAGAIKEVCSVNDIFPVFLPMQPRDIEISNSVAEKMGIDYVVLKEHFSVNDILSIVSNMHMAIGMRLHMLIYAATQAVPIVGIVYDPKINGFMDYAGQDKYVYADNFDKDNLIDNINSILKHYDEIKQKLEGITDVLKMRAKQNGEAVAELLREDGR